MFGIGMPEMLLILAIALIVIGPKKLPDLAKSLGKAMREFKQATSELKESIDLDSDMKQVRESFDDIRGEVQGSEQSERRENDPKPQSLEPASPQADAENSTDSQSPEPAPNDRNEKADRKEPPRHG